MSKGTAAGIGTAYPVDVGEAGAIVSRRGRSFDWTTAVPDDGDAAGAARDIQAWLDDRLPARDWERVLGPLRDALAGLVQAPLVRGDPRCREILAGLGEVVDMAEVEATVSALGRRVAELRARADARPVEAPPTAPARARRTFML